MGRYPSGPTACISDPSCRVRITSMKDIGPVTVFVFWAVVLIACSILQLCKHAHLKRRPIKPLVLSHSGLYVHLRESEDEIAVKMKVSKDLKLPLNRGRAEGEELLIAVESDMGLQFTGYRWTPFGEACYFLCILTSLHWIALYVLILVDTYNKCEVRSIDDLCFFGNNVIFGSYDLNGKVFFVIWWLSAIWFTVWVMNKGNVHNWFRMPCEMSRATVVYVWARDQQEVLSSNVFFLVHMVRQVKDAVLPPERKCHFQTVEIKQTKAGQRYFLFQGQRYLIHGNALQRAHLVQKTLFDFSQGSAGLTTIEAQNRLEQIGLNEMSFKPEPLAFTAFDELFTLFHVYQLMMYMLQFWNSYLFVASLMTGIVLLSAAITIYSRHQSQVAIGKMTKHVIEAEVLRDSSWKEISSSDLVPGDVVRIKSNVVLPCDLLILKGSCVCNESMLTGEAMPVHKCFAPNTPVAYQPDGHHARHTLFSGTIVLQAGSKEEDEVEAIVAATGMATSKGKILSSILYPEKMTFKYDEELPIVVLLLFSYAVICFIISLIFQNNTGAQSIWVTKWIYCMAIINQIMSPLLPVALEVGQLQAVERLKARAIYCLNPKRIAIAGKIQLFCFDKTGTLTEEGLEFVGVQSVVSTAEDCVQFASLVSPQRVAHIEEKTLEGLATCHAVTKFGEQFVGNQVEVEMFSAIGWELVEHPGQPPIVRDNKGKELHIIKRNEFEHSRTTMSVIVQDKDGIFHAFCKGSFEKIEDLSIRSSIPHDYLRRARSSALDGCYVLGLGYRTLPSNLSLVDAQALSRDEVERNLQFLALLLFRNELQPQSPPTIQALKEGEIRSVIVTGDNAQCGHYIARQCGMVALHVGVVLGDITEDNSVHWSSMHDGAETSMTSEELLTRHLKDLEDGVLELAITGKAFHALTKSKLMDKLLFYTRIFARFTPSDKVKVVNMHRDRGLIVGMCGDGGNDCGALKAAHAGLALTEAEASVAAPFTSRDKTVASVVELLCEGRAALHTSFACYKFLITYGLMFSILKLCAYWYGIIPCQMDYVFIDGVAVLSLGYCMTLSHPEEKLAKIRPTSSLLGPLNVTSVLGVWIINLFFLVGALTLMTSHPGYVKWPAEESHSANWWTLGDNWESTVLFFTMYFQFITAAFIFTFGAKFRKNVFRNWLLMVTFASLLIFMSFLLLLSHSGFTSLWHVASEEFNGPDSNSPVWMIYQDKGGAPSPAMSFGLRLRLWWLILVNLATMVLWQKVVAEGPVASAVAQRFPSTRPKLHL